MECEEKDPHSALPTLYYTAHVELNDESKAWAIDQFDYVPTFVDDKFDICEDCFSLHGPLLPVEAVKLLFRSDPDACAFKLRWC